MTRLSVELFELLASVEQLLEAVLDGGCLRGGVVIEWGFMGLAKEMGAIAIRVGHACYLLCWGSGSIGMDNLAFFSISKDCLLKKRRRKNRCRFILFEIFRSKIYTTGLVIQSAFLVVSSRKRNAVTRSFDKKRKRRQPMGKKAHTDTHTRGNLNDQLYL